MSTRAAMVILLMTLAGCTGGSGGSRKDSYRYSLHCPESSRLLNEYPWMVDSLSSPPHVGAGFVEIYVDEP